MSVPPTAIRILHLEDNPRDAALIHDLLTHTGFAPDIVRVASQSEFETTLAEQRFDAILADFNVPDYDGLSALRFARQVAPSIPVIVISGSLGAEAAVQCLKEGATDYLLKERIERLGSALARALREADEDRNRRRNEERFAALFNSAPIAIAISTLDGRLVNVNPELCAFVGYACEELIGQKEIEGLLWAEPKARAAAMESLSTAKSLRNYETRFRRKSGEIRSALVSMEILRLQDEPMLLTTIVDVTERKALEAELHRFQRTESVGQLASGIAHDMNNILAPIMMSVPLLRMKIAPDEAEKILSAVEISAQRGAALVRQLLIFGRGVEGERRPVDPSPIVAEVSKICRQTFPRNVTIESSVPDDVWAIHGDATQLHQVILNLAVNARDAMPGGGRITITAENVTIDRQYAAAHKEAKPGRFVLVRVADTGTGIAPEIAERIFDPFFTTKEPGKGTGLGLSTVLGIIKSHGGFVRLQSEPRRGAVFDVHLPASFHRECQPVESGGEALRGHGELVLIVDDEESIRTVLRDTLVQHNYKVVSARDGVEATTIYATNREVKLVVTDLDMPLMDGVNLARVLRHMSPSLPFVVSTGVVGRSGADRRAEELDALNIRYVLTKPYTREKLLQVVQSALQKTESTQSDPQS